MNMQKQKPIWSKILAMLCALALCISMVPAASAAPGGGSTTSSVSKVTMTFTGISEFWTYNTPEQIPVSGSKTDGNVMYALTDNILTITPASYGNLPKSVMFYALAANEPTITGTEGSALPTGVTFSVVNDGSGEESGQRWWIITLSLASTAPSEVTLNAEAVASYSVTVKEYTGDAGYTLIKGFSDTVKHGGSYQFYVIPKTGYQAPKVTVIRGDSTSEPVSSEDGLYTVANIQSDITITIDKAQVQKYAVNFISGYGYSFVTEDGHTSIENPKTVNYDGSVLFKVVLDDTYSQSADSVKVYANGTEISKATNGVYTINNITVNQTVSVTGVEKNKYTVKLPENTDGYYITTVNPTVVEPGGQFTFNVVVNPGYESNNISVTANNTTVEKNGDGSYTIRNITADTKISIDGIEAAQYDVTTNGGDHATFTIRGLPEDNKVGYGTQTFTVTPDAGYKVDSVKVNGTSVTADSYGKYTIFVSNNVDIVVTTSPVVNVTLTTTVTATGDTKYTIVVKTSPGEVTGNSTGISVVGYGTLYSNQSFDSQSLKDTILALTLKNTLTQQQVSDDPVVYSYGQTVDFPLNQLRNTFSYTFNNSSSTERFGAGWIKLSDGQNSWIVFSESVRCE